jgi:hypothetical protein
MHVYLDQKSHGRGTRLVTVGAELELFLSISFPLLRSEALFSPNKTLGLAGMGGCCSTFKASSLKESLRAGNRGGMDGGLDTGGPCSVNALGLDNSALAGNLPWPNFRAGRCGGRGGRFEGPNTGATIRPASIEGVLEIEVLPVPPDRFDIVEMFDTVEVIDSEEPRLTMGAEGLRGGRAGDGCDKGVRGGNLGGAIGLAGFEAA